jgi:hypothetical protein
MRQLPVTETEQVAPRAAWMNEEQGSIRFHCPGCGCSHYVYVKGKVVWEWNGSFELPTFSPSILTYSGPTDQDGRCHSFVKNGEIQFLADCSHELAGQTVDLPTLSAVDDQ